MALLTYFSPHPLTPFLSYHHLSPPLISSPFQLITRKTRRLPTLFILKSVSISYPPSLLPFPFSNNK